MANSLSDFSRRMAVRAGHISGDTTRLVRRTALAVDAILVSETPVDTGRAKSNWLVSLNTSLRQTTEPYAPGRDGNTAAANEQAAMDQAEAVISHYTAGVNMSIHITNNLPYIGELNNGSSHQAPAGFVEDGIAEAVRVINSSRIIRP